MKYQILVFLWGGGHIIATSKKADSWALSTARKHKAKLLSTDKYKSIIIQQDGDVWGSKKVCVI